MTLQQPDSWMVLLPKDMDGNSRSALFSLEANPELLKRKWNAKQPIYHALASNNTLIISCS